MGNYRTKIQSSKLKAQNKSQHPNIKFSTFKFWIWSLFGILILGFGIFAIGGCGDLAADLSSLIVSPASSTVGINTTKAFTVVGRNTSGYLVEVTPTWSVTGGIGTINSSGMFSAGTSNGSGEVVATYGTVTDASSVTVTGNGWIKGRVTDNTSARPNNLKVYIDSTYFDFTNSTGDYSISNLPAGTYEVWTDTGAQGQYRPASAEVTVGSGETVTQNFSIEYYITPTTTTTLDI
ncbi:hypothetical protein A2291_01085 [candidate division WOR-1 bacterium RIFOXYB2_FULL_42_35]|uniref:BIG2 domain-containing protein n=1 Tax=candidate division WOR-1 bacterium RIFOXYC2_FULL_41_25 TaxID=1802586 RepID=A0A1F4TLN6_UNCSA|nr:MAG: hypothetical protein A2247_02720 [candidate division WOR-1 bacterium RIFOXYA2_FULL_41_14]OGC23031.1 MAG: hypothetical protein A2291_01085 [candidate division WOR-1 bacterium RIFOXYB2_FULL_42_35]OGC33489.1 MAG: hypothetical protein A2462_06865 [candidate division WOR-1 bacterium RIFOXYC2_FULL_41_25]OGC44056.1 MAG: hypothetical protein A2548_02615 [candidate division WOR-1 bacterium RIFOXYD2_FULL_41_8]